MNMAERACRRIEATDPVRVRRWLRERTQMDETVEVEEVLVGEPAVRALHAETADAVSRLQQVLEKEGAPADWADRAEEVLSEHALKVLREAGTATDLRKLAEERLVGVVRGADGELLPFRTIDVAYDLDTGAMLEDGDAET